MSIKNYIFKTVNRWLNYRSGRIASVIGTSEDSNAALIERFELLTTIQNNQLYRENLYNVTVANINDPLDRKEYEILKKYYDSGFTNQSVDARDVFLQLDKIQVAKDLKIVEENQAAYDPNYVLQKQLKARVLLGQEGAEKDLQAFLKDKEYFRKNQLWSSLEEKNRHFLVN